MAAVMATIAITVMIIFLGATIYYSDKYKERRISDLEFAMERTVADINFLQSLISNASLQAVADSTITDSLQCPKDSVGTYLAKKHKANEELANLGHVATPISEIIIYSNTGETYSSLYRVRSAFKPEENDWYQDFKSTGKRSGFTKLHKSVALTSGYTEDVISYVLTFYDTDMSRTERGDLIVNIKYSYLKNMLVSDPELVLGSVLYDGEGNQIYQSGENMEDYEKLLLGAETGQMKAEDGNLMLISGDMGDGWLYAQKISNKAIYKEMQSTFIFLAMAFLIVILALEIVLSNFIKRIIKPINILTKSVAEVGNGALDTRVEIKTGDELELLADGFNQMTQDLQVYMHESIQNEKIKRKMTVDKLMNQINPHFIYNTLNSIVYMAKIDGNNEIVSFTNAFISLLQGTLRIQDSVYIPLREEMTNINNYITLQKFRYSDKFDVEIQCDEADLDALVPAVMLEPIVENAIFHGLAPKEEKGLLQIIVKHYNDKLKLVVADDGIGMDNAMIEKLLTDTEHERGAIHKVGVANVRKRLKQIYGQDCDLIIESTIGRGTSISVELPYMLQENQI